MNLAKQISHRIKRIRRLAVGEHDEFSLESRIFHSFSTLVFVILPIEIIFNLTIGLPIPAAITLLILIIQIFLYYLSRVKGKLILAVTLSGAEVICFTSLNYFYNSGIAGGTTLLYAISLFMTVSVTPRRHWKIWFTANLIVVLGIMSWEYFDPSIIKVHYTTREAMFIDNMGTYIVVVIILYVGTSAIRKNYTAQKRLTDEKTLSLEMLNAEKDKLFSIISHDLRSPLALTQQYFSALKKVEIEKDERQLMEQELIKNISNAQDLLNNLLSWAKKQMEGVKPELVDVDLHQLLQKKSDVYAPIAAKKNIQLSFSVNKGLAVKADLNMLKLIIRNLLNNAVKFTPAGGHITLSADKKGGECIISVSDNGIGIPADKQANIFTLKASSTYGTENEKGTGLGLVLCKEYAELQGGKIWFTSAENEGTTFYVSLPCAHNCMSSPP